MFSLSLPGFSLGSPGSSHSDSVSLRGPELNFRIVQGVTLAFEGLQQTPQL